MTPEEYKKRRLALGLSQGALAARLGISRATVNAREAGRISITIEAARALMSLRRGRPRD